MQRFDPLRPLTLDIQRIMRTVGGQEAIARAHPHGAEIMEGLRAALRDEAHGVADYRRLARLAQESGKSHLSRVLNGIADVEDDHHQTLTNLISIYSPELGG